MHPVREYLDGLTPMAIDAARAYFDGIAGRLWGAPQEDDAIESEMLKRQLVAAVRRVRAPGTKVDEMLIFHGKQGAGKSRLWPRSLESFSPIKSIPTGRIRMRPMPCKVSGVSRFPSLRGTGQNRTDAKRSSQTFDRYRPALDA